MEVAESKMQSRMPQPCPNKATSLLNPSFDYNLPDLDEEKDNKFLIFELNEKRPVQTEEILIVFMKAL
jgi:hypothetical protein